MSNQDVGACAYGCPISAISIMTFDKAKRELSIIVLSAVFSKQPVVFFRFTFSTKIFGLLLFRNGSNINTRDTKVKAQADYRERKEAKFLWVRGGGCQRQNIKKAKK